MQNDNLKFKIIFLAIIAFGIFGMVKNSLAVNYYVSQDGAGSKNGTSVDNAWDRNHIIWGAGGVSAGDTLYIIGELHDFTGLSIGAGGTTNNYLTISGADATSSIFAGLDYGDTGWIGPDAFGAYSRDSGWNTFGAIEWMETPLSHVKLKNEGRLPDGAWVAGSYYWDNTTTPKKFYYKPSDGILTGKTLTVNIWGTISINGHDWVKINDLKIFLAGIRIGQSSAANYVWINNCSIENTPTYAISANISSIIPGSNNGRVSYCAISDAANGIYLIAQTNGTAANNNNWRIDHNNITNIYGTGDAHGIGVQGGTGNIFEYNDISYANTGITMWTGTAQVMNNNILRYNHIYNMEGDRGNGRGQGIGWEGTNTTAPEMTGNYVYGNIVHDCTSTGSYAGVGGGIRPKFIDQNNYIYNNVVRNCDPNYYFQGVSASFPLGGVVKNNISIDPKTNHWLVATYNNGIYSGLTFNNNLYYPDTETKFNFKSSLKNFSDWKIALMNDSVIGADADSLAEDPLFTNASGNYSLASDFQFQSSSPAINAGTDVGLTEDYAGNPIVGTPDIGAYEYQGDIVPPAVPSDLAVN